MSDDVVAVNRFPVIVATGSATYTEARMILTQPVDGVGRMKVWANPGAPVLDTSFTLAESNIGPRQADWGIQTTDGVVTVRSSPGCGCGNQLKYWTPPEFQPMRMGRLR